MNISASTIHALRELQEVIGTANEAKGFHGDRPDRADFVPGERGDVAFINAERCYQANLQMLIVSEAVEAHDEIRHGRAADETYYPDLELPSSLVAEVGVERARELIEADNADKPRKPEGVPSEIADGIIRGFDYLRRRRTLMGPLDKGRPFTPGKVYMAPAGTEAVLTSDQWQEVGYVEESPFSDWGDSLSDTIRTRPPVIGTTMTFACIPPKTRREKREHLAGLRLLFGDWPTHFPPKRQLIHNGKKP